MFKNILVPTDGSDHAEKAVDIAGDLANQYGAKITLFYCYNRQDSTAALLLEHMADSEHPDTPVSRAAVTDVGSSLAAPSGPTIYSRVGQMVMQHANNTLRDKGLHDFDNIVANGDPAKQILNHARDLDVDMIIMGSRGRSDLEALVMGSVSHQVSHRAACTCVTVK